MAQGKNSKGNTGNKGFGSMDEEKQRQAASHGGRAAAQGDTSNRGFASMDKDKQREISIQGGKASQAGHAGKNPRGSTGRNEQKPSAQSENRTDVSSEIKLSERDLNSLDEEDEVAGGRGLASYSETDEDEDEGLGDGKMGRSSKSPGSDEEG